MADKNDISRATPSEFTYGHCSEKAKPGGCRLHNLHCGYPDCDRRKVEDHDERDAVAWLHYVVQGDGEPDQALSFSRDSFPLDTHLGFRSLGAIPLYTQPSAPRVVTDEDVDRGFKAMDAVFEKRFPDRGELDAEDKELALQGIRAALESFANSLPAARVPDVFVLVPVEPTEEMVAVGCDQHECEQGDTWYKNQKLSESDCIAIYKAMIAAAPQARERG